MGNPLNVEIAASNFLALVDHLGLKTVKAIEFSFGSRVLLQTAIEKPDLLSSLIVIGSTCLTFTGEKLPELTLDWHARLLNVHAHGDDQIAALFKTPLEFCKPKKC